MNDCEEGLLVQERVQVVHKLSLRKDLPDHSCHLLLKQKLRVQKVPPPSCTQVL